MLCWAPLLIFGGTYAIQTPWHHTERVEAPYVEVQSCRDGVGVHVAAGPEPWVVAGVHYGWTTPLVKGWELTIQPKLGLSYSNTIHPWQGRQVTRFEVGVSATICQGSWCVVGGYRHLSNGEGWSPGNVGLDFLEGGIGFRYE